MKLRILAVLVAVLVMALSGCEDTTESTSDTTSNSGSETTSSGGDLSGPSAAILAKYLTASQNDEDSLRGATMDVEINADIPKLKEHGRLQALRSISKVGQITYRVLGFQGDNTVKNQVIARYLQAEQEGQGDQSLAITPANYKFKYKGQKTDANGKTAYIFQISPRKKKVGLFKGEIWLDSATYLPLLEKGQFVKNPSVFFKKVDFERDFTIKNGIALPQHITSTIDARLVGRVQLEINFSNVAQTPETKEPEGSSAIVGGSTASALTAASN